MPNNSLWALTPDAVENFFNALQQEKAAQCGQPLSALAALPANAGNTPPPYVLQNGVACVPIGGVIDRVARLSWSGQPYTAGQDCIRAAIIAALNDPAVQSILLCINSPGGVVAGTKELADFVAEAAKIKPCAAYADGLCASAAYWLAAATGRVFAPVTASVGGIGVIAVITDWSSASEKYGVTRHIITGGKWKAAGHPDKAFTEEERQYFQAQISQLHSIFCADVASGMRITAARESWGEGQLLLAEDASKVGLVTDIVRDVDMAVKALADMAKQPRQPRQWSAQCGGTLPQAKKEKLMTMEELKAQHPDLCAALLDESKAQASADAAAHVAAARESVMALVKALAGEEMASRVSALAATGITPEQIAALAPMLAASKAESATAPKAESAAAPKAESAATLGEVQAREKALADITQATGGLLPGGAEVHKTHKSALVADAERRAVSGQQRM